MARPHATEDDKLIETWEITFGGTVWVWTYDRREDRYIKTRVGGRAGSKKLHISRDDRKFNQEQVVEENKGMDPFTNGALRLIDFASRDETLETRYHLTQEDLLGMLEIRDEELFKGEINEIGSELIIRRLQSLAAKHGAAWQTEFINGLIEERYPIGGTQRTVQEMITAGENSRAEQL